VAADLTPVPGLAELVGEAGVVLSICPPAAAGDVVDQVLECGFSGLYVDANAISPSRSVALGERVDAAGARYLDGAIIGPPPTGDAREPRLYLAGDPADVALVTGLFDGSDVRCVDAPGELGAASALKMAYASYRKATWVLAAVSHALAAHHGVSELLAGEGARLPKAPLGEADALSGVAARAWRWGPEFDEIAATLAEAGLPAELAAATAAVLGRWVHDKDREDLDLATVLDRLKDPPG
jgi:hypothetical protein